MYLKFIFKSIYVMIATTYFINMIISKRSNTQLFSKNYSKLNFTKRTSQYYIYRIFYVGKLNRHITIGNVLPFP